MIDEKTNDRNYPLPHPDKKLSKDVVRIRDSFENISVDAVSSAVSITPRKWQHFAIVNDSSNDVIKMFLDGEQMGINTGAVSVSNVAVTTLRIGDNGSSNPEWIGNIDELRISKGIARWTQNFVPPENPTN